MQLRGFPAWCDKTSSIDSVSKTIARFCGVCWVSLLRFRFLASTRKGLYPSLTRMPVAAPMFGLWQGSGDLGHVGFQIITKKHSWKRCFQPLRIKSDVVSTILGECVNTREWAWQEANNSFGKCPQPRGSLADIRLHLTSTKKKKQTIIGTMI